MTRLLDQSNRALIDATLTRLHLRSDTSYLDVGFGGGRALREAAQVVTSAAIYGTDFSPDVIAHGQRRFARLIAAGRLTLLQADITEMPLRDGLFDRISTINTIYFWPDPTRAAAELMRLTAPDGRVAIGFTGAQKMDRFAHLSEGFARYEPAQVEALMREVGFETVRTDALRGAAEGEFVTVVARSR